MVTDMSSRMSNINMTEMSQRQSLNNRRLAKDKHIRNIAVITMVMSVHFITNCEWKIFTFGFKCQIIEEFALIKKIHLLLRNIM